MSILDDAKHAAQQAAQGAMLKAIELAPESWLPGGKPDPLIGHTDGLIGAPVPRVDGPRKVRGRATFAAEFALDHLTYAAVAFSTVARGRIATLDTAEAEAAPGVVLVMTYRNAPRMQPVPMIMETDPKTANARSAGGDNLAVLQDDQIHWNGQPIAVVLAESQEQADHAKSLIRATYEAAPATTTLDQAKANGTEPGTSMGQPLQHAVGDAEAALAAAHVSVDHTYRTPHQNHNAIEPHAATVAWDGDELTVHDATQAVVQTAWSLSQVFGLEPAQVHVTSPFVGGGFGGKMLWQHQVLGAAAAKLAGRPVRIALSREGVYRVVGGRPMTEQRVAIGADADGRFAAIIHTGTNVATRRGKLAEGFVSPSMVSYAAGSFKLDNQLAYLDIVNTTQMRAPGGAVGTFALECAVDELAVALGVDPIELRLRNEPAKDPIMGTPFSSRHAVEAWRAGAERFGWSERNPTPGAVRDGEWRVGIGCAGSTHAYVRMPGSAARITLTRDLTRDDQGGVRAKVESPAHEMGMGTATVHTQVAAERLGLPLEGVSFVYGDSTLPGVVLGAGSQQTAAVGVAVMAAHTKLVSELLKLAGRDSPLAGLTPDEVVGVDGGLAKRGEPGRHERYASILARAGRDELAAEAEAPPPLEFQRWSMHSTGALFCEVRVNAVTGEPRVSRFLGSFDCGRILNAKTGASQLRGGIVMGLGLALQEETQLDPRTGRIVNASLAEYHVPVHMDVPEIDVMWTDIPDPHAPMGAHGIGELGINGVGAAVANAVYNATGTRVRELPITLDKLM